METTVPVFLLAMICQVYAQNGMTTEVKRAVFCQEKLDLAFIIDSSSSIPTKDFELQINFVKDIVRFLDFGSDQSRVAAVSFSNKLFPEFQFDDYTTKDEVLEAIAGIQHSRGDATRTYLALEHTNTVLFKPGNGERPDAKDVVIVLTDGETNSGSYDHHWAASAKRQTQFEAGRIKARPAVIFAIGVGSAVDVAELNGMSSDPDELYTIQFATFGDLNTEGVKQVLLDKKCGESIISLPPITTTSLPCSKTNAADIFFIIDESSSLHINQNFYKELRFVSSVIEQYELGPSKVRVGLMTFSTNPRILLHLNDFKTKSEIVSMLENTPWVGGDTQLDKAFDVLMSEGMSPAFGGRSNVPQIVIVITDGRSTSPEKTDLAIRKLRQRNYIVYAIGVGPKRDPAELAKIASDPRHVFEVENLNGLWAIRNEFILRLCPGELQPTPQALICRGADADVIFIADSSTSIGYQGYDDLKRFAIAVVRRLSNGSKSLQVGLITFADEAEFQFRLNTFSSTNEIINAIDKIPYTTGNTNTHKALELLDKYAFSREYGGRDGVPRIAIVITDGTSRQPSRTRYLAVKAHNQGIIMFSIGVGIYIDQLELDAMASRPISTYSFSVDNYAALTSIEDTLADRTCSVSNGRGNNNPPPP